MINLSGEHAAAFDELRGMQSNNDNNEGKDDNE